MFEPEEAHEQRSVLRRLEAMGLAAEVQRGGRCVVATLPLGGEPFPTLGRPRRLRAVRFASVGTDHIKCVAPRALFYLPLIPVSDCRTREQLEARIRKAWHRRLTELARTRAWLDRLGVPSEAPGDTPQWTFTLRGESSSARVACIEPGRVILPGCGALSETVLSAPEERIFRVGPASESAVDLEIAVTTRVEELARRDQEAQERRRRCAVSKLPPPAGDGDRAPALLLVGPGLCTNRALQDSFHLRGFQVRAVRSIQDSIDAFQELTYELVLSEVSLDRADGIELIPALRSVAGVSKVPVVLVDERPREARREAARRAGARAYLAPPLDLARVTPLLMRLVDKPRERRFMRYPHALAVSWPGCLDPAVTASIGRGGMFVRTNHEPPIGARERYEIHLAEFSGILRIEAEVVYRIDGAGAADRGVGLRFRRFPDANEPMWVGYLTDLERASLRS